MTQTEPLFDPRSGHSLFGMAFPPRDAAANAPRYYGVHLMLVPTDPELRNRDHRLAVIVEGTEAPAADAGLRVRCEPLDHSGEAIELRPQRRPSERSACACFDKQVALPAGSYRIEVTVGESARANFTVDV